MDNYTAKYYDEALLHYGVKGMRWGVRKKRETKGRRRKSKNDGANERRYVQKETARASSKGTKVALGAIAFGCSAIAVGYFFADTSHREAFKSAFKHVTSKKRTLDDESLVSLKDLTHKIAKGVSPKAGMVIPKGHQFSRITGIEDFSLKDHHGGLYAAFTKRDIAFYKKMLMPRDGGFWRHQAIMEATGDIRIPSKATAEKLYRDLMKNDKNYKKDIGRAYYRMMYVRYKDSVGPEKAAEIAGKATKRVMKKATSRKGLYFQNTVLTNKGKAYRKYARQLAKKGYDGVLDYHDIRDKVGVAPIIITNKDKLKLIKNQKIKW